MPPILDLAWQITAIGYAVEVFKDVFQRAATGTVRAFTYGAAFVLVALMTWKPGLPWTEYVLTVLVQGGGVASAAWAAHAAVKAAVPTLPTVAAAEAKVKGELPVRTKAELEAAGRAKEEAAQLEAEAARITAIVKQVLAERITPSRVPEPLPVVVAAPPVVPELPRVPRERDLPGGEPSTFVSKP